MFWRSLCSKFFGLRDYFERFLCWLDHWLSCVLDCIHICVFHISKNSFEKLARHLLTPPRYLAIYRASQAFFLTQSRHLLDTWWIDWESSCLLNNSLTPGGSIKLLFLNLILCCSILARYLSCRALLKGLYILSSRSFSHFFDLSRSVCACSSPKHSLFHSQPLPQGFFKLFQVFLHLVSV